MKQKPHPAPNPGVVSEILSTAPGVEDQGLPGQAVILTNCTLQLAGTKPPLGTALPATTLSASALTGGVTPWQQSYGSRERKMLL